MSDSTTTFQDLEIQVALTKMKSPTGLCICGCNRPTKGLFAPGDDGKVRTWIERAIANSEELSGIPAIQLAWFHKTYPGKSKNIQLPDLACIDSLSPKRNPPWQRDELILALDLYFKHPLGTIGPDHPDVIDLSDLLNALPIHQDRPDPGKFRNPNGVYMKLGNIARFDPNYKGKGLDAGSKLDEVVWNEFSGDRQRLREVAKAIRSAVTGEPTEPTVTIPLEDEEAFPEGKIGYRLHRQRERDRRVVELAKKRRLEQGKGLSCEACGFDFHAVYGAIGEGYIEAHHMRPISEMQPGEATKTSDLVLVCSNCHRMLHRRRPWLSTVDIQQVLQKP